MAKSRRGRIRRGKSSKKIPLKKASERKKLRSKVKIKRPAKKAIPKKRAAASKSVEPKKPVKRPPLIVTAKLVEEAPPQSEVPEPIVESRPVKFSLSGPKTKTKRFYPKTADMLAPSSIPPQEGDSGSPDIVIPKSFFHFTEIECTGDKKLESSQVQAAKDIDEFLTSSDRYLIIQGFAGTGKTFLLGLLNKYLKRMGRKRMLMAPTGRAARILSRSCDGSPTSTIHSKVYKLESMETRPTGIRFTFNFPRRKLDPADYDIIAIVDEGSLVGDKAPRKRKFFDFGYGFGTGRLLTDLMAYLGLNDTNLKTKLIVVGDPCQLPPVQESDSYALSQFYLSAKHRISAKTIALTQIVRQAHDSGIIKAATKIRQVITENIGNYLTIEEDGKTVYGLPGRNDLVRMAISKANEPLSKFVIICLSR